MRIGLDLRSLPADEVVATSVQADRLGLWAVLIDGGDASASLLAAELATQTDHIHLAPVTKADYVHPLTVAEEISILDHLSRRRVFPVLTGSQARIDVVERLLLGQTVGAMTLAPPPAQAMLRIHQLGPNLPVESLSGDLAEDREIIDRRRGSGVTHLFVTWPGPLPVLARHLASRAAGPDFPEIVASHADTIAPLD